MIIPIRCFTCGKVIADKWKQFKNLQEQQEENITTINDKNKKIEDFFKNNNINRYCCKRMFMGQVDTINYTNSEL
jgi:DNA-directed RNA polymerase subunit N